MTDTLVSDIASWFTHAKEFDGKDYILYNKYKSLAKAEDDIEKIESNPKVHKSHREECILYDTKWSFGKRYKVYVPKHWNIKNKGGI